MCCSMPMSRLIFDRTAVGERLPGAVEDLLGLAVPVRNPLRVDTPRTDRRRGRMHGGDDERGVEEAYAGTGQGERVVGRRGAVEADDDGADGTALRVLHRAHL